MAPIRLYDYKDMYEVGRYEGRAEPLNVLRWFAKNIFVLEERFWFEAMMLRLSFFQFFTDPLPNSAVCHALAPQATVFPPNNLSIHEFTSRSAADLIRPFSEIMESMFVDNQKWPLPSFKPRILSYESADP